jgi:hypothetical protein
MEPVPQEIPSSAAADKQPSFKWRYTWRPSRPGVLFAVVMIPLMFMSDFSAFSTYGRLLYALICLCNLVEERGKNMHTHGLTMLSVTLLFAMYKVFVSVDGDASEGWLLWMQFFLFVWTSLASLMRAHPVSQRDQSNIYGQIHRALYDLSCSTIDPYDEENAVIRY